MNDKLCVNCDFHYQSKGMKEYNIRPRCQYGVKDLVSPVDGEVIQGWSLPCGYQRSSDGKCGPRGKHFRDKKVVLSGESK